MAEGGGIDDVGWHTDLVLALSKQKDIDRLRELCRGRKIPAENRADVWKVCLNVVGKPDALSSWDGLLDLNEQATVRDDCRKQATKLRLPEDEAEEVARDMEGIITFYCKSRNEKYNSTSGLTEVLAPFMMLELPMNDVYNCFYAMLYKYIPSFVVDNYYNTIEPSLYHDNLSTMARRLCPRVAIVGRFNSKKY